jgi:hypothetical protein
MLKTNRRLSNLFSFLFYCDGQSRPGFCWINIKTYKGLRTKRNLLHFRQLGRESKLRPIVNLMS